MGDDEYLISETIRCNIQACMGLNDVLSKNCVSIEFISTNIFGLLWRFFRIPEKTDKRKLQEYCPDSCPSEGVVLGGTGDYRGAIGTVFFDLCGESMDLHTIRSPVLVALGNPLR